MGRIVINETENKQTVILNDSPAGVEGGYFDAQMVWHDMGGGGGETPAIPEPFVNRRSISKVDGRVYYSAYASKRICSAFPFPNPGKLRVLDNDYAINLIGISNMSDATIVTHNNLYDLSFPASDAVTPSFTAEAESDAPYVWVALSKTSGEFTAEECLHPLGTVFEIVEE